MPTTYKHTASTVQSAWSILVVLTTYDDILTHFNPFFNATSINLLYSFLIIIFPLTHPDLEAGRPVSDAGDDAVLGVGEVALAVPVGVRLVLRFLQDAVEAVHVVATDFGTRGRGGGWGMGMEGGLRKCYFLARDAIHICGR